MRRGGAAGADYLLSLTEQTLDIAARSGRRAGADPGEAWRHGLAAARRGGGRAPRHQGDLADPVIDPIHFGFMTSLSRYAELRRERPDAEILMGTGNLTELTDADSSGVTAMLLGICSELRIRNLLVVQVSPHTRRTIEEHDAARRIMFAAREDASLPRATARRCCRSTAGSRFPTRRARSPRSPARSPTTISASRSRRTASTSTIGTDTTSRRMRWRCSPGSGSSDGAHAFYLGAEMTKAEIAWRLGKRYAQDEPLDWGCAADAPVEDRTRGWRAPAPTLKSGT